MIMRFLPFHFCNPLQTDVNRLQSDAFRVQLDAFARHFVASRLHLDARRVRLEICKNRVRGSWKMQPRKYGTGKYGPGNTVLENSARSNPAKKYSPHAGGGAAGMGAACAFMMVLFGARIAPRLRGANYSSSFFASSMILAWFICGTSS